MSVVGDALVAALEAVERRESLIPTNRGKKPIGKWKGAQAARADAAKVREWAAMPNVAGFAVVTGEISGLVVVDFDGENGRNWIEKFGVDPHVRTPRNGGGYHVRVRHPGLYVPTQNSMVTERLRAKWPGIDIRGDGGYAIEFGASEHGEYRRLQRALSDLEPVEALPAGLARDLGLFGPLDEEESAPNGKVLEGHRHRHLLRVASAMADRGRNEREILLELQSVNERDCEPPKPDQAVRELAADVAKRYGNPARQARGEDDHALGVVPDYPVGVLPAAARGLVREAAADGLPAAIVAGAGIAALAAAVGGNAEIELTPRWHERAILWVPCIAPRGAGKSPAMQRAFDPIREHDAMVSEEEPTVRVGDLTLEALARSLAAANGHSVLDLDELVVMLRGLGEYKRGGGGDQGRFLSLWDGAPWSFTRVAGGKKENALVLRIPRPSLVIVGGLQPALHELLGGEHDGMRPRWLPHLATMPTEHRDIRRREWSPDWEDLLKLLLARRGRERRWRLDDQALAAFNHHKRRWTGWARHPRATATLSAALDKAPRHLLRIALVLAEAESPAAGGTVSASTVNRAAAIVAFTLDCWRALPEQGGMALSMKDRVLDTGVTRLLAWLEEHGDKASRREIQRAHVGGVRTAADLNALLSRYEATFPGTVTEARQEHGSTPTIVVRAPTRSTRSFSVATGDTEIGTDETPSARAKSEVSPRGDTPNGDTSSGDTPQSTWKPHRPEETRPDWWPS